jgi:glutamine cyclotransferase
VYNLLPIDMSRIATTLLIFTFFLVACGGNDNDASQLPVAAAVPKATEVSNESETGQALPTQQPALSQNSHTYPAPIETGDPTRNDETATAPEPTLLPTAYPGSSESVGAVPISGYRVFNTYPHDRGAWTQGLTVVDGKFLLEGTGWWGYSSLRRVNLATGEIIQFQGLPETYFGEGITIFEDKIIQLTWQSGIGFVYDSESFEFLESFSYSHEGWGITHDGEKLIVSDGTDTLHFWDPVTMAEIGRIQVTDASGPVFQLNELEYVEGEILANVWQTDLIARISPETGQVIGWINLSGLLVEEERDGTERVLNGIAYDQETGRLFVTGKLWPLLFEIELVP